MAGIRGGTLFDPLSVGVMPRALSSACWRGYHCVYRVTDAALELGELTLGLSDDDLALARRAALPGFEGLTPEDDRWSGVVYRGLARRVPFTGGALLADGFIQELYVHMGYHPAWKYREVHELLFEDGRLLHAHDRSSVIAELRARLAHDPLQPGVTSSRDDIARWVESTFSLDYGSLLPRS